jgi:hypothetical protein
LTYTLVQVLEEAAFTPLTYRELAQRIQLRYGARPDGAPTPMVEGPGQARVVLGTERPKRSPLTLTRDQDGYHVNAGELHGLTRGSILAVHAPAGAAAPELLGHVRVTSAGPFEALVVPCAHAGKPERSDLPQLAPCEVVYTDYGLRRLKLAVAAGRQRDRDLVLQALGPLRDPKTGLVRVVDDPRSAEWAIRLGGPAPELVEASGSRDPYHLPSAEHKDFAERLREGLEKVYRARSLLSVAEQLERERGRGVPEVDVEVEVLLKHPSGPQARVVAQPVGGWVFRPGDQVAFRIRNRSQSAHVDVALLVIGLDLRIAPFYPPKDELGKTLAAGEAVDTLAGRIDEKPPFGREHLVAIAVPARNPPVDFSLLAQEGWKERGQAEDSPLAQLLEQAVFRAPGRGGLDRSEVSKYAMRVLTWRTKPLPDGTP